MKARALRADAERNRRHILDVAQAVFAAEGLTVPIDEIARRAGLGVGTLYRHFPTKEALLSAILITRVNDITEEARTLPEADDPTEAFFQFLVRMIGGWSQKKDFVQALTTAGVDLKEVGQAKEALHVELAKLLERAQSAGSVRTDISMREVMALLIGTFGSIDRHGIATEGRDRMLTVVFDGLRAGKTPKPPVSKTRTPKKKTQRR